MGEQVNIKTATRASMGVLDYTSKIVVTTPKTTQHAQLATPVTLPQIVKEDSDLVALIRQHRARLGLAQFELDQDAGLQDGYGSKLEGPGRSYGRRPTKLTKPINVKFNRETGEMVSVGKVSVDRPSGPFPVVTAQAVWYLQAMGLSVVVMDRQEAEAMCKRPVPFQVPTPRARSGRRVRRLSFDMTVSGIDQAPLPVPPIRTEVLSALASQLAKAQDKGAPSMVRAMRAIRAAGYDPEALSIAVRMNSAGGLAMLDKMARVGAYLSALNCPDVTIGAVDVIEHVRDMPETEQAEHAKAVDAWAALVASKR